jgi:hypothetical protein
MSCDSGLGSDTDDRLQITLLVSHRWWKEGLLMRTRMILRVMTIRDENSLINVVDSVLYGIIASGYFPYSQMSHRYD